jgi:hypothetical protein
MKFGVGLYSDSNYKGDVQTIANSAVALERVGPRIASVRVPPGWQVNLWDSPLPGLGNFYPVTGNLAEVPTSWRDRIASVEVLQNGVQIFKDASFAGTTRTLAPGRYDAADLGTLNNSISSLRIPSDWRVRVYTDPGFTGAFRTLYGSTIGSLGAAFNDTISGIVVEQAVTVYTDEFYFGNYQILWEGDFEYDDVVIPDWSISSIIVPPGYSVTASDSEGLWTRFTSSQLWMPDGWDDRITSLSVRPLKPAR